MNMRLLGAKTIKDIVPEMVDAKSLSSHFVMTPQDNLFQNTCTCACVCVPSAASDTLLTSRAWRCRPAFAAGKVPGIKTVTRRLPRLASIGDGCRAMMFSLHLNAVCISTYHFIRLCLRYPACCYYVSPVICALLENLQYSLWYSPVTILCLCHRGQTRDAGPQRSTTLLL